MTKPSLRFRLLLAAPLLAIGCAATRADAREVGDVMVEVVDPQFQDVLLPQAQRDVDRIDTAAVAVAARTIAGALAELHGPLALPNVRGFAALARGAEQELLHLAALAQRGERQEVQRRILRLEADHCDRCHAAAEDAGF
jgi:hypothetical protein